jgi:hypothetical protein
VATSTYPLVPFEFGLKRAEGMGNRALITSWQPRLQTVYLEELALLQHRVFGADTAPAFCRADLAASI